MYSQEVREGVAREKVRERQSGLALNAERFGESSGDTSQ
jgi:hypothetical protein